MLTVKSKLLPKIVYDHKKKKKKSILKKGPKQEMFERPLLLTRRSFVLLEHDKVLHYLNNFKTYVITLQKPF